jgi:hypothetical protein
VFLVLNLVSSEQRGHYFEASQRYFEIYVRHLSYQEGQQLVRLLWCKLTDQLVHLGFKLFYCLSSLLPRVIFIQCADYRDVNHPKGEPDFFLHFGLNRLRVYYEWLFFLLDDGSRYLLYWSLLHLAFGSSE